MEKDITILADQHRFIYRERTETMKRVPLAIEINDVFGAETQLAIVSLSILLSKCT